MKVHSTVVDYLQRSAAHLLSKTDYDQALALGKQAIQKLINKEGGVMLVTKRISQTPYQWEIDSIPLNHVANQEYKIPENFISSCGMNMTQEFIDYAIL